MKEDVIFGNFKDFGIRYIPGWQSIDGKHQFATIHLVLKGQIIGNPSETCLLGTWLMNVESLLLRMRERSENIQHKEFLNRTDNDIFEMIYKANQLEEEYESKYLYLPVLPNQVWESCNININETIDAYLLTITAIKDEIRFIWKGYRDPCPAELIGQLYSIRVNKEKVMESISECLKYIKKDKMNYKAK